MIDRVGRKFYPPGDYRAEYAAYQTVGTGNPDYLGGHQWLGRFYYDTVIEAGDVFCFADDEDVKYFVATKTPIRRKSNVIEHQCGFIESNHIADIYRKSTTQDATTGEKTDSWTLTKGEQNIVLFDASAGVSAAMSNAFPTYAEHDVAIWLPSSVGVQNGDRFDIDGDYFVATKISKYQSDGVDVVFAERDAR